MDEYIKLVKYIVRRYQKMFPGLAPDLSQEAYLAVIQTLSDSKNHPNIKALMGYRIQTAILRLISEMYHIVKLPRSLYIKEGSDIGENYAAKYPLFDIPTHNFQKELMDLIFMIEESSLNLEERKILMFLLCGYNQEEIRNELGFTRDKLTKKIKRIRIKWTTSEQ